VQKWLKDGAIFYENFKEFFNQIPRELVSLFNKFQVIQLPQQFTTNSSNI
jgi:hypothetical protein